MLSQILKLSIILLLLSVACKQNKIISQNSSDKQIFRPLNDTIVRKITNNNYSLSIETHFSIDTLNVIDYKEDKYSSPIITFQRLLFFDRNRKIKEYKLPIKNIDKKTITGKNIVASETPIYKICLSNNFYIVFGSDYCNGSECNEFTGIYSMNGDIIYEGFSNERKTSSLKDILNKNSIKLNGLDNCINVDFN